VCHRDLKPENIIVRSPGERDEHAVIIDFGIATANGSETTTETTRIAGSPAYMAPEQLLGRPTAASDIYSLGVIVFELLTSRRLHELEITSQPEKVAASQLAELRRDLPPRLRQAVARAVCFDWKSRYGSVMEFSEAFNQTLPTRRPVSRVLWAAPVMLLAVAAAWLQLWKTPPAAPERELTYRLDMQRFGPAGPLGPPVPFLPGETALHAGDGLRVDVRSSAAGYVYVLNESEGGTLSVLFPAADRPSPRGWDPGGNWLEVPSDHAHWLRLDRSSSHEAIWIVWSESAPALLERAATYANSKTAGEIPDAALVADIRRLLSENSIANGVTIRHRRPIAARKIVLPVTAGDL
jgi:hypothetical protein